jgi:hypothetical protein
MPMPSAASHILPGKFLPAKLPSRLPSKHVLAAALFFAAAPAIAQEMMTADMAREFVIGRFFTYQCFDGTYGSGRIEGDGSAAGTIRVTGKGNSHYLRLPINTLYVLGNQVCARLKGLPFEPCFNLTKTGPETFRGSLSNMNFMYCNFNRMGGVSQLARRRGTHEKTEKKLGEPVSLDSRAHSKKAEPKKAETPKAQEKVQEKAQAKAEDKKTEPKATEENVASDMKLRR